MYIMKEQQHGSSKVKYITNGGQLPLSCGYTANVSSHFVVLHLMDLNLYSRLWKEHYLVCKFSSFIS